MAKLGTPQNVSIDPDSNVLSWDAVPGATAYDIYADNTLLATVVDGNNLPVRFKASTTAAASDMTNTTKYPIEPGTLYFTKDNYLVRDYIDASGAIARATLKSSFADSVELKRSVSGTGALVSDITLNGNTIILTKNTHTHSVSYDKATGGSVSVPSTYKITTTSTAATLANGKTSGVAVSGHSYTPAGSVTISKGTGTANYTPAGSVSITPTTVVTSLKNNSIKAVKSMPTWSASVTGENLTLSWTAGSTETTTVGVNTTSTASSGTFTGTGAQLVASFTGTAATLGHSVTQGTVSGSVNYDKTTKVETNTTASATVTITNTATTATCSST